MADKPIRAEHIAMYEHLGKYDRYDCEMCGTGVTVSGDTHRCCYCGRKTTKHIYTAQLDAGGDNCLYADQELLTAKERFPIIVEAIKRLKGVDNG